MRLFIGALLLGTTVANIASGTQCAISPASRVSDACISYEDLDTLNRDVGTSLNDLRQTDFFAYYRLNLYNKVCPFWSDESSTCGNRACAVDTIDDEQDIPLIWRAEELSKLEGLRAEHPAPKVQRERPKKRPLQYQLGENVDESCVLEDDDECDERDYCVPEDEGATSKGDYVSLLNNPEKFTGYSGPGAQQVWDAIYKENCFAASSAPSPTATAGGLRAAANIRNVFQEYGRHAVDGPSTEQAYALDDQCIEQRAFYRIISGMHASISTHICWDYFNQTTGQWHRNVDCYQSRLHDHPERVSNLYFNYALVTRAISKLHKHLQSYTFCSGDPDQDYETKQKVLALTQQLSSRPLTFDENVMFQDPSVLDLKDDFKHRFRNVSRIMDCVGCDKCRLWGKLQTAGYGAALKVLFEFDETKNGENPHLRRTELVALINTFGRLSHSMEALRRFRNAVNTGDVSALWDIDEKAQITAGPGGLLAQPTSKSVAWDALSSKKSAPAVPQETQDDDDLDFDYEAYDARLQAAQNKHEDIGLWDEFKAEFDLIWRTYKMVLRSWIDLPFKMSAIFIMEMNRLWNFWLGLPVPPRSWDFKFPTRDEL